MPPSGKQREIASMLRGVMLTSAVASKTHFINWSQFTIGHDGLYDEWIGRGLCQGLSAKYLDCVKRGLDFVSVVNFEALKVPGRYEKTALHKEVFEAAVAGNLGGGDIDELNAFMRETYGFTPGPTKTWEPSSGAVNAKFASFVTETNHYYMISFPGHALAATAIGGRFHFFDPNCGIVQATSGGAMRSFLTAYTRQEFTKKIYGKGAKFTISATRYS